MQAALPVSHLSVVATLSSLHQARVTDYALQP